METVEEVLMPPLVVMSVRAEGGPRESKAAFDSLEKRLGSLSGRKFYGVIQDNEYRACVVQQEGDDPVKLGLECETLPGGKYGKAKIRDWPNNLDRIPEVMSSIASGRRVDSSRPELEYYRSRSELVVLVPLR